MGVFVGNMPYGMSDDYVKDLVYTVRKDDGSPVNPEVLRVTVPRDEETGKDRGLAFIKVLDATQAADLSESLDARRRRPLRSSRRAAGQVRHPGVRPREDPQRLQEGAHKSGRRPRAVHGAAAEDTRAEARGLPRPRLRPHSHAEQPAERPVELAW